MSHKTQLSNEKVAEAGHYAYLNPTVMPSNRGI